MRRIYQLIALASFAFMCSHPAIAQGYDPNQGQYAQQQQGGYQQPPSYQQYAGLPQTTPNYGYAAGGQQQPQYAQQPEYGQPQLQQQQAQYGQMPQAPTYYGQAQQTTPGATAMAGGTQQVDNSQTMPAGSFLNDSPGDTANQTPDKSTTENPNHGHSGAALKAGGHMLGKFVGGVGRIATPAASLYLMNKAVGGHMRVVMPMGGMGMGGMGMGGMGMGGMGYGGYGSGYGGGYGNPYMGSGMRNMMGGW